MTQWLKQSTSATVKLGPFVDDTDGKTAETGLTISQADIRLTKNGGDFAQTNNSAGATHDESGYYDVPLDTTDTATLGRLRVSVSESGALPVWQDFMVVPANVWDSMFGSDYLDVTLAARTVEGTIDELEALKLMLSALVGKTSGGGTATLKFRDTADSKDRITATVDANKNRTAITLDVT